MPKIEQEIEVYASIERVFDLSRSIDLHRDSQSKHGERAIAGRVAGLIEIGEIVTWEATHFGIKQQLTSKILKFERPQHFRDSMVSGAFKRFDHDHIFDYESPLGMLGTIADKLFLKSYMKNLLLERNQIIKKVAESDNWAQYLNI